MDLKGTIEVASDVCGGLSGIALLVPTYRVAAARALIKQQIEKLLAADPNNETGLREKLILLDLQTSAFDETDAKWLKVGMWLLLSSFFLKLVFHFLTKLS